MDKIFTSFCKYVDKLFSLKSYTQVLVLVHPYKQVLTYLMGIKMLYWVGKIHLSTHAIPVSYIIAAGSLGFSLVQCLIFL